jgi:hypothetical protein
LQTAGKDFLAASLVSHGTREPTQTIFHPLGAHNFQLFQPASIESRLSILFSMFISVSSYLACSRHKGRGLGTLQQTESDSVTNGREKGAHFVSYKKHSSGAYWNLSGIATVSIVTVQLALINCRHARLANNSLSHRCSCARHLPACGVRQLCSGLHC